MKQKPVRQFIVTIEGDWIDGDKRVTAAQVQSQLRQSVRHGFEFLARTSVKKYKPELAKESSTMGQDSAKGDDK